MSEKRDKKAVLKKTEPLFLLFCLMKLRAYKIIKKKA